MQFVKTIKKELDSICIYSKQIIVFSFWCSIILFAIALISYRMAFSLDYHVFLPALLRLCLET